MTAVDEKNIIVVKELAENETYEDLEKTAEVILNLFKADEDCEAYIAYGTVVNEIKEVSRSYKEARMALDVVSVSSSKSSGDFPSKISLINILQSGIGS